MVSIKIIQWISMKFQSINKVISQPFLYHLNCPDTLIAMNLYRTVNLQSLQKNAGLSTFKLNILWVDNPF